MLKALVIGGSLGLLAGVLMGTVGGSSMLVEVIFQMVIGAIGGLGCGVCYYILTRKKGENETFMPSPTEMAESKSGNTAWLWIVPLISILVAAIKGFVVGAKLGQ